MTPNITNLPNGTSTLTTFIVSGDSILFFASQLSPFLYLLLIIIFLLSRFYCAFTFFSRKCSESLFKQSFYSGLFSRPEAINYNSFLVWNYENWSLMRQMFSLETAQRFFSNRRSDERLLDWLGIYRHGTSKLALRLKPNMTQGITY